jgi:hypothetical protein
MSIQIANGIQLPAFDVELLTLGKLIAVPFIQHRKEGQVFWLYPSQQLPCGLNPEQYYQPEYLTNAKEVLRSSATLPIQIKAWGRCEYHWRINPENKHLLPNIAQSTVWKLSALEHFFERQKVLKLLFLRVFRLSQPCIVNVSTEVGAFYWPDQSEDVMSMGSESDAPVLSQASFNRRKSLLLAGQVYPHTDLEALHFQVEQLSRDNPTAKQLNYVIKQFLRWNSDVPTKQFDQNLAWINTITELGYRSKEQDTGKSNYQAGTDFENAVRDSLEFLGFTIDYSHRGGAGSLDLFCSKPYSLVGECKAGKKIPNDTAVQLLNLGTIRLEDKKTFDKSAKLIIGPGEPTEQLKKAAKVHGMAILNPETLEKLVKLHSKHQGAVDLFKLKAYLIEGQADDEVEKYIKQVELEIHLRSHIVQLVKKYLENADTESAGIDELHAVYVVSNPPQPLKREKMQAILIELSSPLTGYLGRKEGSDWRSDRFYFLRELKVD